MILDGKRFSSVEKQNIASYLRQTGLKPGLATVLVGDDPASHIYVRSKIRACAETGIESFPLLLPSSTSTAELLKHIHKLNSDPRVHGILIQLPLPPHMDTSAVIEAVSPQKDVDCFHPFNLGRLFEKKAGLYPCTPAGIMELIGTIPRFSLKGKKALVVGASSIVGKPMALMFLQQEATAAVAHKQTLNLKELTLWADIIVSATGQPRLITADMVREGCVLLDVGMHRGPQGLSGDCDFAALKEKALAISPVPGGVGPMTILYLLKNTVTLAEALKA